MTMKNKIMILLVLISYGVSAQNITAPAEIAQEVTWSADTVFLEQDLNILNGAVLSIAPGVVVMSQGNYKIDVQGAIVAKGTELDSIIFTVADTTHFVDTSFVTGGWKGFYFNNVLASNDSSLFEYCIMEYGKAFGTTPEEEVGGVLSANDFRKLRVSHSTIRHNRARKKGGAFALEYTKALINYNRFVDNLTFDDGGAIYMSKYCEGMIDNNVFKYNTAFRITYIPPYYSFSGAGAAAYISCDNIENLAPTFTNNQCYNNKSANGIFYDGTMGTIIQNNIICNNECTSAIFTGHTFNKSRIINNTIANNTTLGNFSGGHIIYVFEEGGLCVNNLIWGNDTIPVRPTLYPKPQFSNMDFEKFKVDSVKNNLLSNEEIECRRPNEYIDAFPDEFREGNIIDKDPLFVNPSPGTGLDYDGELYDWSLQDESPAVNNGYALSLEANGLSEYDAFGNSRIFGNKIDIGAIENQNVIAGMKPYDNEESNIKLYPNPAQDWVTLEGDLKLKTTIDVYTSTGMLIKSYPVKNVNQQTISLNVSDLKQGVYFIKIEETMQKLVKR